VGALQPPLRLDHRLPQLRGQGGGIRLERFHPLNPLLIPGLLFAIPEPAIPPPLQIPQGRQDSLGPLDPLLLHGGLGLQFRHRRRHFGAQLQQPIPLRHQLAGADLPFDFRRKMIADVQPGPKCQQAEGDNQGAHGQLGEQPGAQPVKESVHPARSLGGKSDAFQLLVQAICGLPPPRSPGQERGLS
jgi:hypothetical protein